MRTRFEDLSEFEFNGCYVRSKNIIGFSAQKWLSNDPLEKRETAVFFYYPDEEIDDRWAVRYLGDAIGINCCATFTPSERWVCLLSDGQVYVVGKGDDDYEKPVSERPSHFFSNIKSVQGGNAIAVGPGRKVFLRQAASKWVQLNNGLFPQGDKTDLEYAGFNDVDGFSGKDMYACGGRGDLWHYDGRLWENLGIPTNSVLKNICCADDGFVYITTNRREILKGRGATWKVIQQDKTEEVLEDIVCYNGMVIISTSSELFTVDGNRFKMVDLKEPKMNSKAHIATSDGILVVAGKDEASVFDGKSWSVILEPE